MEANLKSMSFVPCEHDRLDVVAAAEQDRLFPESHQIRLITDLGMD